MNLLFKLRTLNIRAKPGRTAGAHVGWFAIASRDFLREFQFTGGRLIKTISVYCWKKIFACHKHACVIDHKLRILSLNTRKVFTKDANARTQ